MLLLPSASICQNTNIEIGLRENFYQPVNGFESYTKVRL